MGRNAWMGGTLAEAHRLMAIWPKMDLIESNLAENHLF